VGFRCVSKQTSELLPGLIKSIFVPVMQRVPFEVQTEILNIMTSFIFEEKICLGFTGLYENTNMKRIELKLARTLSIYSTE
jgi:hypothetical protein